MDIIRQKTFSSNFLYDLNEEVDKYIVEMGAKMEIKSISSSLSTSVANYNISGVLYSINIILILKI